MSVFINPGGGPVAGSTRTDADANIEAFVADLTEQGWTVTAHRFKNMGGGDGRIVYEIDVDGSTHEVKMPGIPLDGVRWMDLPDQNIWDFPRLYVDGGSWVWLYALGACAPDDAS
jgi:hypothetical protein